MERIESACIRVNLKFQEKISSTVTIEQGKKSDKVFKYLSVPGSMVARALDKTAELSYS